jgi:hypothetical protein
MAVAGIAAFSAILAGCGGNSTGNATISGTVSGLAAGTSVTLANNNGTPVVMSSNSGFSFSNTVPSNGGYSVLVTAQPTGQTCVVNYGSGVIDFAGNNITNVAVVCAANVPISVVATGLNAGNSVTFNLTLQNDAANFHTVTVNTNNTAAQFPILLPLGTIYNIVVSAQPGQTAVPGSTTPVLQIPTATGNATQVCTTGSPSSSGGVVSLTTPIVVDFSCH